LCGLPAAAGSYIVSLGGSYTYMVTASAVDAGGNTFLTGSRYAGAYSFTNPAHGFVSKVDPAGNVTLVATFGGEFSDQGNGIAVDASGNLYVAGTTSSPDFPLRGALQNVLGGAPGTGFVMKLKPDGTVLYSTFLGGTGGSSAVNAVTVDSLGNAYVTGSTYASDYPHTAGLPAPPGVEAGGGSNQIAFFAKISAAGDQILYGGGLAGLGRACGVGSTCFMSDVMNVGVAIAVDPAGNAYIGGNTFGTGLPTTPGALRTTGIGGFVAKVNAAGTGFVYVTLLGSANYYALPVSLSSSPGTAVYAIAADASGTAYICGNTADPNFPATAASFQPALLTGSWPDPYVAPPSDAFVAKLNPTGSAMEWATFLGGSGNDYAGSIAIDPVGDVWVAGATGSYDFPLARGPGEFLAELDASGQSLLFATTVATSTVGQMLAIDPAGTLHGATQSGTVYAYTPFEGALLFGVANAAGSAIGGIGRSVAPGEMISLYRLGPAISPVSAAFDAQGFLPTLSAGVQVEFNGTPVPLLYVSGSRIDAMVPLELAGAASALLRVVTNGVGLPDFPVVVQSTIPGVFENVLGYAAATNQDGTANSASNPAQSGSLVSIWVTGVGWTAPGADGQQATTAQPACSCSIGQYGLAQAIVPAYAGSAPGMVTGVVQINFPVTSSGYYYSLIVNGVPGPGFSLYVTP
jgi:uncharacterized protein (TIGR03437 family)